MSLAGTVADFVVLATLTVVVLMALGTVVRRVLGVRVGIGRVVLAGLFGLAVELAFELQFLYGHQEYTPALIPLQLGIIVLGAVGFLLLAELLVPPGTIARPDQWWPATRRRASRTRRYLQIVAIAVRRGLLSVRPNADPSSEGIAERQRQARALRLALEDAGGAFVKLGQVLSTRSDVLPPEFLAELRSLQERVGPAPWDDVRNLIEQELGAPIGDLFTAFEPEPLAAASIGQVHRAVLRTGEAVAVKVQRPGIVPLVERDLDIALRIARRLEQSTAWGRSLGVLALAEGFAASLRDEIDYRIEAANMAAMGQTQARHAPAERVRIPGHHPELSTRRVLVMDLVTGLTLSDPRALTAYGAEQRAARADLLFNSLLVQILDDGVFHADLHPGNVMLSAEGITLLDFGSIGRLDSEMRRQIGEVLLAFYRGDSRAFADALLGTVRVPAGIDESEVQRQLGAFMANRLGPGAAADVTVFTDLVRTLAANELAVPGELAAAFRAIATLEGTLRYLSPGFDLLGEAGAFAEARIAEARHPTSVAQMIDQDFTALLPLLRRAPLRLDRIAGSLAEGRLSVNVRLLADQRDRSLVRDLVNQVVATFLAGVFGIMGAMLLVSGGGPLLVPGLSLFELFGYLVLVVSGLLTMRVLYDVFRLRRSF